MTPQEAKAFLNRSDAAEISALTGYSISYVRQVLRGERNNAAIADVAVTIAETRRTVRARQLNKLLNPSN